MKFFHYNWLCTFCMCGARLGRKRALWEAAPSVKWTPNFSILANGLLARGQISPFQCKPWVTITTVVLPYSVSIGLFVYLIRTLRVNSVIDFAVFLLFQCKLCSVFLLFVDLECTLRACSESTELEGGASRASI